MIQLLRKNEVLTGEKGTYQVIQTLSSGNICTSYLCRDEEKRIHTLRHYQQGCPMLAGPRKQFLALKQIPGVLPPKDSGTAQGLPFDVFPMPGKPLTECVVGNRELICFIIPQLNAALRWLHASGLLIRDLCPEHIRFDADSHQCWLSAFDNLALIPGGASATRAPAEGLPLSLCPPEYKTMGWSIYSDYYALGLLLLAQLRGNGVFSHSTRQIQEALQQGRIAGQDPKGITRKSYELLSVDQKLQYLILGLTLPDPHQRWHFGEVRCWCSGQALPLIQSGERVTYQMSVPFVVGGESCYDYRQLALALAKNGTLSGAQMDAIIAHMKTQSPPLAQRLMQIKQKDCSQPSKLFFIVYTMAPTLSGFWWNGRCSRDTEALAAEAGEKNLSQMLLDGCFSFLTKLRSKGNPNWETELKKYSSLEQWEREEHGKGVARFLIQMGGSDQKGFSFGGRYYKRSEQLLRDYQNRGMELHKSCVALLKDQQFQAWIWARGQDDALQSVLTQNCSEEEAFFALLCLLERLGSQDEKKLCRELYLHWGEGSPITWLRNHLDWYSGDGGAELLSQLRRARWTAEASLEELSEMISNLMLHYQNIVRNTETNVFKSLCGIPLPDNRLLYPNRPEGYFSCTWEGNPVTPAFLRWIGQKPDQHQVQQWCDSSAGPALKWLEEQKSAIQALPGFQSGAQNNTFGGDLGCAVLWLIGIAVAVFCVATYGFNCPVPPILLPCFAMASLVFPVRTIFWSYGKKAGINHRQGELNYLDRTLTLLGQREAEVKQWHSRLPQAAIDCTGTRLRSAEPLRSLTVEQDLQTVAPEMEGGSFRFLLSISNAGIAGILALQYEEVAVLLSAMCYAAFFHVAFNTRKTMSCVYALFVTLAGQITCLLLCAVFGKFMLAGAVVAISVLVWFGRSH